MLQDCKRWLQAHGVTTSAEMAYYIDSVQHLLQSVGECGRLQERADQSHDNVEPAIR